MPFLVLHPYVAAERPADQRATWDLLARLREAGWAVADLDCAPSPFAYPLHLASRWDDPSDWMIIEHDVAPTAGQFAAMVRCPELACTAPYTHSGHPAEDLSGRQVMATSLGCTKVTAAARRLTGPWPVPRWVTWHMLDSALTGAIAGALVSRTGKAWHPHPPVSHHHGEAG